MQRRENRMSCGRKPICQFTETSMYACAKIYIWNFFNEVVLVSHPFDCGALFSSSTMAESNHTEKEVATHSTLRSKVESLETSALQQEQKIGKLHEDVESTLKLLTEAAGHIHTQDEMEKTLKERIDVLEEVANDHQSLIEGFEKNINSIDSRLHGVNDFLEKKLAYNERQTEESRTDLAEVIVENRHLRDDIRQLKLTVQTLNEHVKRLMEEVL